MKIKIIAEIGPNHNGNIQLAKKLILKRRMRCTFCKIPNLYY